jgi:hypothetical protein
MTWLPEWRVTVGDDVYTTVTSVSFASGRTDIDRQPTAGYCQLEIMNTTGAPFTVNITETVLLEVKNGSGTYVTLFSGEVSDFNIGVKSPDEAGFITYGTILGVGALSKLSKAVYNTALVEGLDGAQIGAILGEDLQFSWDEVTPTDTWATYTPTTTWNTAETYLGTVDSGFYTMIPVAASATTKSQSLVDQIANSALGQVSEGKDGFVNYDDADHRSNYLAANGYVFLDGGFATPSTIKSTTQIGRLRNSLIYRYSTAYGSTYSTSSTDSIATYGLYEKSTDSNIKNLVDITDIGTRELRLRSTPKGSLEAITFRLDNPDMPTAMLNSLIGVFFGMPVLINNLPSNLLGGTFEGFVENVALRANPTFVDLTLYISSTEFSLSTTTWDTVVPPTITWATTNAILTWNNATGALN